MDGRKRKLIDEALDGADIGLAERVREAVMEGDRLGAKSRFVAFVMDNVSPDYFRTDATDAVRPVRGADLEGAVKLAYNIRSRNVHVLEDLPPEAWILGDGADTVSPPDTGIMLSHEGLARLARHVVRSYIDQAPAETDLTFDWRASLPGKVQMRLAPQYWVWKAEGFDHKSVSRYFAGFVSHLVDTIAGRTEGVSDMRGVLERIEQLSPGIADGPDKTLMVAIYALWHSALAASDHRPQSVEFLTKYAYLFQRLEVPSFVVGLLTEQMPDWTDDEWHTLATARRAERERRNHLELPAGFDAALQVMVAERLLEAGRADDARTLAGFAVEELPGYEPAMEWEAGLTVGRPSELDLRALVLQLDPGAGAKKETSPDSERPEAPRDPNNS
jgi:hypothetical protein